jgi:hypothetical protein
MNLPHQPMAERNDYISMSPTPGGGSRNPARESLADCNFQRRTSAEAEDSELGSIAPGKRADFLLVEGNPAERISDLRRCRLVMKNGVLYKSDDVYNVVGIKPAD